MCIRSLRGCIEEVQQHRAAFSAYVVSGYKSDQKPLP